MTEFYPQGCESKERNESFRLSSYVCMFIHSTHLQFFAKSWNMVHFCPWSPRRKCWVHSGFCSEAWYRKLLSCFSLAIDSDAVPELFRIVPSLQVRINHNLSIVSNETLDCHLNSTSILPHQEIHWNFSLQYSRSLYEGVQSLRNFGVGGYGN
jgi:hypothetical protein